MLLGCLGRDTHLGGKYVYLVLFTYYIEVMTKSELSLLVAFSRHQYSCDEVCRRLNYRRDSGGMFYMCITQCSMVPRTGRTGVITLPTFDLMCPCELLEGSLGGNPFNRQRPRYLL